MSTRYLANLTLAVAAGFLVVVTQAFATMPAVWLSFGVAIGITIVGAAMALARPGLAQRIVSGLVGAVGAWTIVATLVFAPAVAVTLAFASALAVVALAIVGLSAHELTTERVVHSFELETERRVEREPIAA